MASTLRFSVLGMAHDHVWSNLKTLSEFPGAELVAGADLNPTLRTRFSERSGCNTTYEYYDQLLDAEKLDGVLAFSSTAEHADIVELCAARGLPVMVEKPMAATLEQASRILTAARKNNTVLMGLTGPRRGAAPCARHTA
ncbi:MAG: Gfo/Idh/MocA family protein [Candidatus Latescibacterota bacterium]|jgi:predicted dehydrogenase